MNIEEFLLVEHREIVELYNHYSTNIAYCFISYLVLNGVLASFFGSLLIAHPALNLRMLACFAPSIAIIGNIIFVVFVRRFFELVSFLANRGTEIENILRKKTSELDTFRSCVMQALKLNALDGIYAVAIILTIAWTTAFVIIIVFS